jgi:polysaccharide biosynthesis protein PslH
MRRGSNHQTWSIALKPDLTNIRILQFASRVCWPLDTGAKLRNYHLARVLSQRANVTLLAFGDHHNSITELEKVYERAITVPRRGGYTFDKIVLGAIGRTPLPLLNYTTEGMKQALAKLLAESHFDVIQVESIHLMNYLPLIRSTQRGPLAICDWHNIESELMHQYSNRANDFARRAYARKTARLMKDSEKRALTEFDAHVAVSERDAERLRSINPHSDISVIENGVDAVHFAGEHSGRKKRLVFVGSMDYHANIDGAISFARNVWPELQQKRPELIFTIVGRDPAPTVRQLSSVQGIEVTGSVEDVRPYYHEAVAAVIPLNVGGGSRLKILEAMAAGVPVVSTSQGAEGLEVQDDENILLADGPLQLAEAIARVLDDEALRRKLVTSARHLITERYDWSTVGAKLFAHYRQLLSARGTAAAAI